METGEYGKIARHQNIEEKQTQLTPAAVPGSVFFFAPNKGAPVFFAVSFALSGAFHVYQCM
jgi:hypothetical protein